MRSVLLSFVMLAGCTKAGSGHESPPGEPTPTQVGAAPISAPPPVPVTAPPPKKPATRVELTAVTLADDCGGRIPQSAPAPLMKGGDRPAELDHPKAKSAKADTSARARRRCEQTSMQLAIIAGDATTVHVKSVELFDDAGKSLGMLAAAKPMRWSEASATYEAWDEAVAANSTSNVIYVLEQPKWDRIGDRWNRTYTLKTVVSIGGIDQTAQKDVTLRAQTSLPPNVKT